MKISLIILILTLGYVFARKPLLNENKLTLDCSYYDSSENYLACEQVRATQELVDIATRTEEKKATKKSLPCSSNSSK